MANNPGGATSSASSSARYNTSGSDRLSSAAEDVLKGTSQVTDAAKEATSEASERLKITVEDQKRAGAERLAQFARAALTAANQLDRDSPEFARYIRGAAEQVQGFSEQLRTRNVRQLFDEFQSFAKRHPTAFLGATALTGFALSRFLKSSTDTGGMFNQQGASSTSSRAKTDQRS
jgi:hypothetical protein